MPARDNRKFVNLFKQLHITPESSGSVSSDKTTSEMPASSARYYDGLYDLVDSSSSDLVRSKPKFRREDILQALDLFFSSLFLSEGITDATRSLLVILRSSIVKVALQNPEFLIDARHPARRLIKSVVATSQTVVPAENYTRNGDYVKMHTILCALSKKFERDERVFLQAYFEIRNLG